MNETVIIAENDTQMRGLLRTMLNRPGRDLVLCANGSEAVDLAGHVLAALVLLDFRMPKMDGIEACRLIRALPRYQTVPIAILTVFDEETPRRRAFEAGATAFLAKPFSQIDLLRLVDPLLETRKHQEDV